MAKTFKVLAFKVLSSLMLVFFLGGLAACADDSTPSTASVAIEFSYDLTCKVRATQVDLETGGSIGNIAYSKMEWHKANPASDAYNHPNSPFYLYDGWYGFVLINGTYLPELWYAGGTPTNASVQYLLLNMTKVGASPTKVSGSCPVKK